MIRSVNVPQMVNGSDAGSPSFSLEEMSQEEVVGIYGKEEMTIPFEADSGSCMGSEKGYVSFLFSRFRSAFSRALTYLVLLFSSREFGTSSETSLTTHSSDSSLVFIFPPTHLSYTSNPPKAARLPFPSNVHEPPPSFCHPPLPLTAIGCRQSQNQEHRLSVSYLDFTPSIETSRALYTSALCPSSDPATIVLSAQALIAQAKRARTKSIRKRRSSAPSLSSPSTVRRSNTSSIISTISTISMSRAPSFGPSESAISNGESPSASPTTPLSPTRSNGRESGGAWRGLRRALSLGSRESSNPKRRSSRTSVLDKDEACKASGRCRRDGERANSRGIDQRPQGSGGRPFTGPSSPSMSIAEEWGDLGTLLQFPKPPINCNLRRKSVRSLAGLGSPLLLLPKDGEEEDSSGSESEREEGKKIYARPPSGGLPSTPSADSQSSQESSLPPHTPIADASPSLPPSLLLPILLTPTTPTTPHTHAPSANKKMSSLLSPETVSVIGDTHRASQRTRSDLQSTSVPALENNSDPQAKLIHSAMSRDWQGTFVIVYLLYDTYRSRPHTHLIPPLNIQRFDFYFGPSKHLSTDHLLFILFHY